MTDCDGVTLARDPHHCWSHAEFLMLPAMTPVATSKRIVFVCGVPTCDGVRHQSGKAILHPGPCPGGRTVKLPVGMPVCDALTEVLNSFGVQVERVYSMAEARKALVPMPTVVITDALLADGDGFLLCRKVKQRSSRIPVIILSSRRTNKDCREKAAQAKADGVLRYPIDLELLQSAMWNILGRPQSAAAPAQTAGRSHL